MNFKGVWEGMCLIVGVVIIAFYFSGVITEKVWNDDDYLIKQCEAELPRNQHCKLIAVPEVSDD